MSWNNQVPFTTGGSLMPYVGGFGREVVWKANFTFEATLHLHDVTRGRSAARFVWKDESGVSYDMFMTDLAALIMSGNIIKDGKCTARWTFTKRGQNYGIKVAND